MTEPSLPPKKKKGNPASQISRYLIQGAEKECPHLFGLESTEEPHPISPWALYSNCICVLAAAYKSISVTSQAGEIPPRWVAVSQEPEESPREDGQAGER